jgi:CRISPR-associated endonuclease/helicase Cas3
LHARFPQFQREAQESRWIEALGKDGARRPANGCVLVSTQIAEQSVDIDADLLITDLAPTDMLLQRIGRLWRHQRLRPPGAERQVWIAAPSLDACELRTANAREIKTALGASAKVYAPYVLLRTFDLWHQRRELVLPTDIRPLIEATYAEQPDEPAAWRELRAELEARKKRMSRIAVANSTPWQPQLADEEGVQTRWNGQPTALLLPVRRVWELSGQDPRFAIGLTLLDGTACELRTGGWNFAAAKAVHRNLVRIPLWPVRAQQKNSVGQDLSWVREYVDGSCVACRLKDDRFYFVQGGDKSCLKYTPELGVVIERQSAEATTAWRGHTEDDDEFDD